MHLLAFHGGFTQHGLLLWVELVPQLFAVQHQERCVGVARDTQVLLYFAEFRGFDGDKGVLLAVDGAGFECCEHFAKGHRYGIGAQRFERIQEDVVLHDTHLDAVKVFDLGDWAFAVGQVTEAVFPIGQVHQPRSLQLFVEELTGGAVEHGVGFFFIGKQERQVERTQLFDDADQRRTGRTHHLLGARTQRLGCRQVATGRAAPEGHNLHLAAGLGGQHFLHFLHAHTHGVVFVHAVGELDGALGKLGHGTG